MQLAARAGQRGPGLRPQHQALALTNLSLPKKTMWFPTDGEGLYLSPTHDKDNNTPAFACIERLLECDSFVQSQASKVRVVTAKQAPAFMIVHWCDHSLLFRPGELLRQDVCRLIGARASSHRCVSSHPRRMLHSHVHGRRRAVQPLPPCVSLSRVCVFLSLYLSQTVRGLLARAPSPSRLSLGRGLCQPPTLFLFAD